MGETPFKLTYGVDTMILVEVEKLSLLVMFRQTDSTTLQEEFDLANEARDMAHIREKSLKHRIAQRYNSEVIPRKFEKGDLVLRCANIGKAPPSIGNWRPTGKVHTESLMFC